MLAMHVISAPLSDLVLLCKRGTNRVFEDLLGVVNVNFRLYFSVEMTAAWARCHRKSQPSIQCLVNSSAETGDGGCADKLVVSINCVVHVHV